MMFQSLIGTLQTLYSTAISLSLRLVSIPYRYATNCSLLYIPQEQSQVSIPYRYATNSFYSLLYVYLCLFQSLIGTLQTGAIQVA